MERSNTKAVTKEGMGEEETGRRWSQVNIKKSKN